MDVGQKNENYSNNSKPLGNIDLSNALDRWQLGLSGDVGHLESPVPFIVSVGGGKGGVGKSLLSANLGYHFASRGLRTVVVDLDLGAPNLHTYFGIAQPEVSIADYLLDGRIDFEQSLIPTSTPNLAIVAGGQEARWSREMAMIGPRLGRLWKSITSLRKNLGVDIVLLDLGAGIAPHTLDAFLLAHYGVMTVLSEPTSIENAYVFIKSVITQAVDNLAERTGSYIEAQQLSALLSRIQTSGFEDGYRAKIESLREQYPNFIDNYFATINERPLQLVINQSRDHQDDQLGESMSFVCQRYFGIPMSYNGRVKLDDTAWQALRQRKLLASLYPQSLLNRGIQDVALKILSHMQQNTEVAIGSN